jgi:biopolymer transport protein ExbB
MELKMFILKQRFQKLTRTWTSMLLGTLLLLPFSLSAAEVSNEVVQTQTASVSLASPLKNESLAKVDNPYGLSALWLQSDHIIKIVLLILIAMSMASWYVIVTKLFEQSHMLRQSKKANEEFWKSNSVDTGVSTLEEGSPFRYIADAGIEATKKHTGLHGKVDFNDWMDMSMHRSVERVQRRLSNGMSLLATVGSTSPFVGLFGTVWGIYHALTAIGIAGQASIDKVAGPVGEALIMTAIGLAVAVPAVLGYNWLLRRNATVMDEVRDFSDELHSVLLSTDRPATGQVKESK